MLSNNLRLNVGKSEFSSRFFSLQKNDKKATKLADFVVFGFFLEKGISNPAPQWELNLLLSRFSNKPQIFVSSLT